MAGNTWKYQCYSDRALLIQFYACLAYQDQGSFVLIFYNMVELFLSSLCLSKELNMIETL